MHSHMIGSLVDMTMNYTLLEDIAAEAETLVRMIEATAGHGRISPDAIAPLKADLDKYRRLRLLHDKD